MSAGKLVAAAVALAATPVAAHASPLFELVGGGSGTTGFNARASGASAASTYFNPALLPFAPEGVELGIYVLSDQISIFLVGRTEGGQASPNVPTDIGRAVHEDGFQSFDSTSFPTEWLALGCDTCPSDLPPRPRQGESSSGNTTPYQMLGLVVPVWDQTLVLGLHAMIPLGEFTTAQAFYNDEREQHFSNSLHPELYADRLKATSLAFGVGARLHDALSAGVSFTLRLKNTASAPNFESGSGTLDEVLVASEVDVTAAVSPHFGLVFAPSDRFRLAATAHSPQSLDIDIQFATTIPNGSTDQATKTFTHAYMPWIFGVGGELQVTDGVSLTGTAQYALWSQYRDRHGEAPNAIPSVERCTRGDDGVETCARTITEFEQYAWADSFSGAAGVRLSGAATTGYVDITWVPSPVPPSTGRRNYVDNSRLGGAAGIDHQFRWLGKTMRLGGHAAAHRLLERTVMKNEYIPHPEPNPYNREASDTYADSQVVDELPDDAVDRSSGQPFPGREGLQTNNPGWPGFISDGWILGGSISLSILY